MNFEDIIQKVIDYQNITDEQEALKAVKQNGYDLRYVATQTEAICLEAVKQNGGALCYVTNQTEAICLEAVKQNGYALRYVANQTEAICLEAVKQNGHALCYVGRDIIENYVINMKEEMLFSYSKYIRKLGEERYGKDIW